MARQGVLVEPYQRLKLEQIRKVMGTSHKLYVRFVRSALHSGGIAPPYPFEGKDMVDETLFQAQKRMEEILSLSPSHIAKEVVDKVFQEVPGLLTRIRN